MIFLKIVLPNCKQCKFFDNGYCKLFNFLMLNENQPVDAKYCREDELLCGSLGLYFRPKNDLKK